MVIFNSYVKLPEGNLKKYTHSPGDRKQVPLQKDHRIGPPDLVRHQSLQHQEKTHKQIWNLHICGLISWKRWSCSVWMALRCCNRNSMHKNVQNTKVAMCVWGCFLSDLHGGTIFWHVQSHRSPGDCWKHWRKKKGRFWLSVFRI
jgi:hypothetical protein